MRSVKMVAGVGEVRKVRGVVGVLVKVIEVNGALSKVK